MKKQMIIAAAALMSLALTSCGQDSININVALPETTVSTAATDAAPAETTVIAAETTLAETAASVTDAAQTTAAQTTTAQTTAAAEKCIYSADDLVGEWSMPGTFGTRNNTMTVRKDGSVIMRYAAGGTRFGKLRIDTEDHPNGSCSYWYSVYDDDNTAWIGFPCAELPVNKISSGQDGEMQFVRVSLEDVAVEKMNNMNFLMKSFSGGGGDLQIDQSRTVTVDNKTYALVTDERFAINSLGRIAFKRLLEETVSGTDRKQWEDLIDESFVEQDGLDYVIISNAHGYYNYPTGKGVTITNQTDTSFTAETKDSNQLDGRGSANFVFDGVNWTIESNSIDE